MAEFAVSAAKRKIEQLLELTRTEAVTIKKNGNPVAVLISVAEYERLTKIDDWYWGELARKGLESGFLSVDETDDWLKKKLEEEF